MLAGDASAVLLDQETARRCRPRDHVGVTPGPDVVLRRRTRASAWTRGPAVRPLVATTPRSDAAYLELDPTLREALTAGRPVEAA